MSEEMQCEVRNILSKELCAEAIKSVYNVTKHNNRMIKISVAIATTISFIVCFLLSLILHDLFIMLLSFVILGESLFLYYSYFMGYTFPKSMYLRRINYLCTPQESIYLFMQSEFVYRTEQTSQIVLYSQIKQMIDSKNLLILIVMNKEYIISKKSLSDNYGELINLLRTSSHCSYAKQARG